MSSDAMHRRPSSRTPTTLQPAKRVSTGWLLIALGVVYAFHLSAHYQLSRSGVALFLGDLCILTSEGHPTELRLTADHCYQTPPMYMLCMPASDLAAPGYVKTSLQSGNFQATSPKPTRSLIWTWKSMQLHQTSLSIEGIIQE